MAILEQCEDARRLMEEAIENNFGVIGDCPVAIKRHEHLRDLEFVLKAVHPEVWEGYKAKHY